VTFLEDEEAARQATDGVPVNPATVEDPDEAYDARGVWNHFWAERSSALSLFLSELREIEGVSVGGQVEGAKIKVIREKERQKARLLERWGAPTPPWNAVSTNVLWNIHNTPSAQISMLGGITGLAYAPVAACSTFSVCLKLAMDAIERGEAKRCSHWCYRSRTPPAHRGGTFYGARVLSADGQPRSLSLAFEGPTSPGVRRSGLWAIASSWRPAACSRLACSL
jgi:3-oxoacyl-[acyl-carrier-protein] synthase II